MFKPKFPNSNQTAGESLIGSKLNLICRSLFVGCVSMTLIIASGCTNQKLFTMKEITLGQRPLFSGLQPKQQQPPVSAMAARHSGQRHNGKRSFARPSNRFAPQNNVASTEAVGSSVEANPAMNESSIQQAIFESATQNAAPVQTASFTPAKSPQTQQPATAPQVIPQESRTFQPIPIESPSNSSSSAIPVVTPQEMRANQNPQRQSQPQQFAQPQQIPQTKAPQMPPVHPGIPLENEAAERPIIRPVQELQPSLEPQQPQAKASTRTFRGQDFGYPANEQDGNQNSSQNQGKVRPVMYQDPGGDPLFGVPGVPDGFVPNAPGQLYPGRVNGDINAQPLGSTLGLPPNFADIMVPVAEGQTGQIIMGAAVNSDAGITGQLVISEKNFDIRRFPRSLSDLFSREGTAFRGAGQNFRLEASPGNNIQRYLLSFSEPYLFNTRISLSTSAYYFTRDYFDWKEQRMGGRISLGQRLTPDLSLSAGVRAENVKVFDPRVATSPTLNAGLGRSDLFVGHVTMTHDTRDHPFLATQGHYLELGLKQGFGEFDFPRADIDYRKYFLVRERPDGSGRQTLSFLTKAGFSGAQTPIFENYFAGGFSTIRGFDFRGASPSESGVRVGGEFQLLTSLEYMFPLTADDMVRGVVFVDAGTVESEIDVNPDNFRVAPGFGFRINMPFAGAGGAPLAFDFAFPVAKADGDETRVFAFFMGLTR